MKSLRQRRKPNRKQNKHIAVCEKIQTPRTHSHTSTQTNINYVCLSEYRSKRENNHLDTIILHSTGTEVGLLISGIHYIYCSVFGRKSLFKSQSCSVHIWTSSLVCTKKTTSELQFNSPPANTQNHSQASLNFLKVMCLCKGALKGGFWRVFWHLLCHLKCVLRVLQVGVGNHC